MSCPNCGASEFEEVANNRFRCKHCGATSALSDSNVGSLRILEWICPKCGFDNEKGSHFCGDCGEPLTKVCIKCREKLRWDLKRCNKCGFGYRNGEEVLFEYNFEDRAFVVVTNMRLITSLLTLFGPSNEFKEHPHESILKVEIGKKGLLGGRKKLDRVYVSINGLGAPREIYCGSQGDATRFANAILQAKV